jgi:hypothetical protein
MRVEFVFTLPYGTDGEDHDLAYALVYRRLLFFRVVQIQKWRGNSRAVQNRIEWPDELSIFRFALEMDPVGPSNERTV